VWRFKQRNGLQRYNFSDKLNSAPLTTLPEERLRLRALLSLYNKEDIYNTDETGLFFQIEPNQTLSTGAIAGHKKVRFNYNKLKKILLVINFLNKFYLINFIG
jgi:hypothetical protein